MAKTRDNNLKHVFKHGPSIYLLRLWLAGKIIPQKASGFARGWAVGLHGHSGKQYSEHEITKVIK